MKYIATLFLVLMTATLAVCGVLLWRRRKDTGDYSRYIQAVFSCVSALFALTFVFRTWSETTTADSAFFEPEHTFVPILIQMLFFFYPLEVIKPTVSRAKVYMFLFAPLFMLVFVGMFAGIEYTPLYTYADIWQHIEEFNVWFRIITLIAMLFYCFSLFFVPYDKKRSSADSKFIMMYALGFCLIGLLHFSIQISHVYWLILLHQIVWIAFFVAVAYYELKERLIVPQTAMDPEKIVVDTTEDKLWMQILTLLDDAENWRNPELSLISLSELVGVNRTYVGEAFKRNVGMTFVEYITKRRISYVADSLRKNPETNIKELFNHVGYRQRSTAWRNFQKIMGVTPAEFVEGLK